MVKLNGGPVNSAVMTSRVENQTLLNVAEQLTKPQPTKLKKSKRHFIPLKLFSFQNPGYNQQVNDIEEDAASTGGDRIYCQTTEPEEDDLRLYACQKQTYPTRRRLILGIVIASVILFSIATALVLRFAVLSNHPKEIPLAGVKTSPGHTNSSDTSIAIDTTSNRPNVYSVTTSPIRINIKVSKTFQGAAVIIGGMYASYMGPFRSDPKKDHDRLVRVFSTAMSDIYGQSRLSDIFVGCQVTQLTASRLKVHFRLTFSEAMTVEPPLVVPPYRYTIDDVTSVLIAALQPLPKSPTRVRHGDFIFQKSSIKIKSATSTTYLLPEGHTLPTAPIRTEATSTTTRHTTVVKTPTTQPPTMTKLLKSPPPKITSSAEGGGLLPTRTTSTTRVSCPADQFACRSGVLTVQEKRHLCIERHEVCDGYTDCVDGADEADCGTRCTNGGFRCVGATARDSKLAGRCTLPGEQCDGYADCDDYSDEDDCACPVGEFRCENGYDRRNYDHCIPQEFVCNGEQDCTDGSDERRCNASACPADMFRCVNSTGHAGCVDESARCNRIVECADGSDERGCTYTCPDGQTACKTGTTLRHSGYCVYDHELCNGMAECVDGSDAVGCEAETCTADEFMCRNGTDKYDGDRCIQGTQQCDRVDDCTDLSDERQCEYSCPPGMIACRTGELLSSPTGRGYCFAAHRRCNGVFECRDMSDEADCPNRQVACPAGTFRCDDDLDVQSKNECMPETLRCDRTEHCLDGSDERHCNYTCHSGEFACHSGQCIDSTKRCDGANDCSDNSDELECHATCTSAQFRCHVSRAGRDVCVDRILQCDRVADCPDSSDELGCRYACPSGFFMCENGTLSHNEDGSGGRGFCLREHLMCDNHPHCMDGSDESPRHCDMECDENEFRCVNGSQVYSNRHRCVPAERRCDRRVDCTDGSDEAFCTYTCPLGKTACRTGIIAKWPYEGFCVDDHDVCNKYLDCKDGSDERDCNATCDVDEFRCTDGVDLTDNDVCVPAAHRCDRVVDCSDKSDETGCDYTCPTGSFKCTNGSLLQHSGRGYCIFHGRRCDGVVHCSDGSDEAGCEHTCKRGQFACKTGGMRTTPSQRCIPTGWVCDRETDCVDGSDEDGCTYDCPAGKVACRTGHIHRNPFTGYCILERQQCDGRQDCRDNSDEDQCQHIVCPAHLFKCANASGGGGGDTCIARSLVCDRVPDCSDRSDELACNYTCPLGQHACATGALGRWPRRGYCIVDARVCDGLSDCADGSDENGCDERCSNGFFRCLGGVASTGSACIHPSKLCDKVPDCRDGSDEIGCA